jgi:hypothetical protein
MSTMQQSITSIQQEVHSINKRVEQNQLDLRECLKYHHPGSSDDEEGLLLFLLCFCCFFFLRHLISYFAMLKLFDLYYFVYPGPSETIRGSNFYSICVLLLLCFTLCPFVTKKGE